MTCCASPVLVCVVGACVPLSASLTAACTSPSAHASLLLGFGRCNASLLPFICSVSRADRSCFVLLVAFQTRKRRRWTRRPSTGRPARRRRSRSCCSPSAPVRRLASPSCPHVALISCLFLLDLTLPRPAGVTRLLLRLAVHCRPFGRRTSCLPLRSPGFIKPLPLLVALIGCS